ncbi:MAG: hypothetical protein ACLT1I_06375, partial [Mediterraneibacter faecis]
LLFTRCATSNASRHFKSPLAMGRDAFKSKHASSVSISGVIDTGVNSNLKRTTVKGGEKNLLWLFFLCDKILSMKACRINHNSEGM